MEQRIPGVVVGEKRRRANPGQHAIRMLEQRDQDTAWYYKHGRPPVESQAPAACSWFTVYILEGEWVWTKTHPTDTAPSQKYRQFTRLKKPVEVPCFYCSHCKRRWSEYEGAMEHLTEIE